MDNQKFGAFLTALRKEKGWTQHDLAAKLNITDKAVSKWERGAGFPSIELVEPLANILDVSVLELMHAERIPEAEISKADAAEAVYNAIDVASAKRKRLMKCLLWALLAVGVLLILSSVKLGTNSANKVLGSYGGGMDIEQYNIFWTNYIMNYRIAGVVTASASIVLLWRHRD